MSAIKIVVDGPNFINQLLRLKINPSHLARQLTLQGLRTHLSRRLSELEGVTGTCESVEFICSTKLFGSGTRRFTPAERDQLVDRLVSEPGVFVDEIVLPGSSEKGVDTTIAGRLEDAGTARAPAVVLVSEDRDFAPTLQRLRDRTKVVVVSIGGNLPRELRNQAFASIDVKEEDLPGLFTYAYPEFNVRDFNEESCARLFSEADDRRRNQLTVDEGGNVYFSTERNMDDARHARFRFESYQPYNLYVGPVAASDDAHIARETKQVLLAWKQGERGYVDFYLREETEEA